MELLSPLSMTSLLPESVPLTPTSTVDDIFDFPVVSSGPYQINVPECPVDDCTQKAVYAYLIGCRPIFCQNHQHPACNSPTAEPYLLYPNHKPCKIEKCKKVAIYGDKDIRSDLSRCLEHSDPKLHVYRFKRTCWYPYCENYANYGYWQKEMYCFCSIHRLKNTVFMGESTTPETEFIQEVDLPLIESTSPRVELKEPKVGKMKSIQISGSSSSAPSREKRKIKKEKRGRKKMYPNCKVCTNTAQFGSKKTMEREYCWSHRNLIKKPVNMLKYCCEFEDCNISLNRPGKCMIHKELKPVEIEIAVESEEEDKNQSESEEDGNREEKVIKRVKVDEAEIKPIRLYKIKTDEPSAPKPLQAIVVKDRKEESDSEDSIDMLLKGASALEEGKCCSEHCNEKAIFALHQNEPKIYCSFHADIYFNKSIMLEILKDPKKLPSDTLEKLFKYLTDKSI